MTTPSRPRRKKHRPGAVRETAPAYTSGDNAQKVPAGEFKARCLAIMDDVRTRGTEYVITKHGRPVARLVPVGRAVVPFFGSLRGSVTTRGDILSPIAAGWEALGDE